jgi:putative ATP-binding cassette transporter
MADARRGPTAERSTGAHLWQLTSAYFNSEERWSARGLLATCILLNLATVVCAVQYNHWYQLFFNALERKSQADFWYQLLRFGVIASLNVAAVAYRIYFTQILELRWRRWLTHWYLNAWLRQRAYYWLELNRGTDNPDQRIADDLRQFISGSLGLTLGLLNAVVSLFSFVIILWGISGPLEFTLAGQAFAVSGYMVWAALLYAAVGSALTHRIGSPLIGLNVDQQRREADFRFALQRLRENAEGVALYGGEASEESRLRAHLALVLGNFRALVGAQKRLNWLTSGYGQVAAVFPFLVAAPRFFAGAITLGGLMQITDSFERVRISLSWFIENYAGIASWRASVERLLRFDEAMVRVALRLHSNGGIRAEESTVNQIVLRDFELALPNGQQIAGGVNFVVQPGDRIMVSGRSGTGKSTLLRAIAGIWPFGNGAIQRPSGARMLFLPQTSYLPIGSMRQVVAYPAGDGVFSDAAVSAVLELCRLPQLAQRLDEVQHWAQQLSPGEQQRLAFARALLHKPDWLFLDEATAALDEDTEQEMYRLLQEHLPHSAIVSIAHRQAVLRYHHREFDFQSGLREPILELAA